MNLQRWSPWRELELMTRRLDRGTSDDVVSTTAWAPTVDIEENNEEFVVTAELPGMKKEDVKVTVQDGMLAIEGDRKMETEKKTKRLHRVERFYGHFERSFSLPKGIDEAKIVADYNDGLLHVHLPKMPAAAAKAKEVEVR